jgi:hypothetical protein
MFSILEVVSTFDFFGLGTLVVVVVKNDAVLPRRWSDPDDGLHYVLGFLLGLVWSKFSTGTTASLLHLDASRPAGPGRQTYTSVGVVADRETSALNQKALILFFPTSARGFPDGLVSLLYIVFVASKKRPPLHLGLAWCRKRKVLGLRMYVGTNSVGCSA